MSPVSCRKRDLTPAGEFVKLRLYVLCVRHLEAAGSGNNGQVPEIAGREILVPKKRNRADPHRYGTSNAQGVSQQLVMIFL